MYLIVSLLIVIVLILVLSLLKQEPVIYNGSPHPDIEGMRIGGDGASRIKGFQAATYILNASCILLFIALMVFGISRRYRTRSFWLWTAISSLILLFVVYRFIDSYFNYLSDGKLKFFLGFPEPTAWMIYGIWGGGALFIILYVIGFRKFIYTEEDEAVLQDIAAEYSKEREES